MRLELPAKDLAVLARETLQSRASGGRNQLGDILVVKRR